MKHLSPYIISLSPNNEAQYILYCFSYAGGSGQNYYSWKELLPNCIELRVITLPGRGKRFLETPLESINTMADEIVTEIQQCSNQKILFYGHSMGAALAYECALRLERLHAPIEHLFVGGFRAPHLPCTRTKINNLPQDNFLFELSKYGATPQEVLDEKGLLEMILPMLRADFKAIESYRAIEQSISCPITAFYGLNDHCIIPDQVKKWNACTHSYFNTIAINGSHLFHESHANEIISTITNAIIPQDCDALTA
jgi:medium-chain acyl-[acyl-carrier-protein] hydrolase